MVDPNKAAKLMLTCESAVAAALAVIPPSQGIAYAEFHYGFYCPPGVMPCPSTRPDRGYVVFHTKVRGPDIWVRVSADGSGAVSASAPEPFPPGSG